MSWKSLGVNPRALMHLTSCKQLLKVNAFTFCKVVWDEQVEGTFSYKVLVSKTLAFCK